MLDKVESLKSLNMNKYNNYKVQFEYYYFYFITVRKKFHQNLVYKV